MWTASFAENNTFGHPGPGNDCAVRIHSISSVVQMRCRRSGAMGSAISASNPIARRQVDRATSAPMKPRQCVMLPTKPFGHNGARSAPAPIATGPTPSCASARRAQERPSANSRCREATALRTRSASPGIGPSGESLPSEHAAFAQSGNNPVGSEFTPSSATQRSNGVAACITRPPTTVNNTFASLSCTAGIANRSRSMTTKSASLPARNAPLLFSSPSAHALFTV